MEGLAVGAAADRGAAAAVRDSEPPMFTCPQCANAVGQYPEEGVVTLLCATCTFKFELTGGTVAKLTSRRTEVARASQNRRAQYIRTFELALTSTPRETVRFTFETDRDDDWIQMRTGDRAVVVCSMRQDVRGELLFIVDRTSGEQFVLAKPSAFAIPMRDVESRRVLEERLCSLRARMIAVHLDAYAERNAGIDRALGVLDEQLQMDAKLTAECDRTMQVLEIEYDASIAADSIQVDGTDVIEARLAALREVEELRNDTTRRLAANAEVEALLRSHSG